MVNAVPDRIRSSQLDGIYICPVDKTSSSENEQTKWVKCPMLKNKHVCYGSCLDLQNIARYKRFYDDPEIKIFEKIGKREQLSVSYLRSICLKHQRETLSEMMSKPEENHSEVKKTLKNVIARLNEEV